VRPCHCQIVSDSDTNSENRPVGVQDWTPSVLIIIHRQSQLVMVQFIQKTKLNQTEPKKQF